MGYGGLTHPYEMMGPGFGNFISLHFTFVVVFCSICDLQSMGM